MTFESWIILSFSVFAISERVQQELRDSGHKPEELEEALIHLRL